MKKQIMHLLLPKGGEGGGGQKKLPLVILQKEKRACLAGAKVRSSVPAEEEGNNYIASCGTLRGKNAGGFDGQSKKKKRGENPLHPPLEGKKGHTCTVSACGKKRGRAAYRA